MPIERIEIRASQQLCATLAHRLVARHKDRFPIAVALLAELHPAAAIDLVGDDTVRRRYGAALGV